MDSGGVEMDLSTRPRDHPAQDSCKMRVAKSVFSIRSLVDLGDAAEKVDEHESASGSGKSFKYPFRYCRPRTARDQRRYEKKLC